MRRLLSFLNLVFTTVFFSIIALILYPFDRKGGKINKLGRLWAIVHLKVCGIKVSLEGLENISEPPYIFMCNHQSELDIFALLSSLRLSVKWVAKKELFFMPFLGWLLKSGRNISLDRENPREALKAMNEAAQKIRDGMNIIIFPEGTWSKDSTLLPFKKGGFFLALRAGVPIIPIGIEGTGKLQPEGCFVPREKGLIHITIGEPVYTKKEGYFTKTQLMLEVRSRIERLIGCREN